MQPAVASTPTPPAAGQQVAELEDYRRQFEAIKREAGELLAKLTEGQFNWRPGPGQWSIADCLSHLNVTGRLYLPVIEEGIRRGRARQLLGRGPFRHGFLGNWFVRTVEPPVKLKVKAPRRFAPAPDQMLAEVAPEFMALQEEWLRCVGEADGVDLGRVKVQSPATKLLRLTLGQSLALMAAHERRHLWQARRVKEGFETLPGPR